MQISQNLAKIFSKAKNSQKGPKSQIQNFCSEHDHIFTISLRTGHVPSQRNRTFLTCCKKEKTQLPFNRWKYLDLDLLNETEICVTIYFQLK